MANETPYLRWRKGDRWFFVLGEARARAAGWFWSAKEGVPARLVGKPKGSIPLGHAAAKEEVAEKRAEAQALYKAFLVDSGAVPQQPPEPGEIYPADSLGAWFIKWTTSPGFADWAGKEPRTREDYARAWAHLGPALGKRPIHKITADEFAGHQLQWEEALSPHERFRTVKCARALFKAAIARKIIAENPAKGVLANKMPQGRNAFFVAAEVEARAEKAKAVKKEGLALLIRTAWAGAQSPVDVRTLTLGMYRKDRCGAYFKRERTKTEAELYIALPDALASDIDAYITALERKLKVKLSPNAPVFRKRHGKTYADHKALSLDFARVRALVDKEDKRQLQDIRRSANLEMRLGEATPAERAKILANTLDRSGFLEATYTPPTLELARKMHEKREAGRALLAGAAQSRIAANKS